jgi:hypothetical protein
MSHRTTKDNEKLNTNRLTNHGSQGGTGVKRRLTIWWVMCLIERTTSHQILWNNDSFVIQNPPLCQAPKHRCNYNDPNKQY